MLGATRSEAFRSVSLNNTLPSAAASESFCGLVDIGERRLFAEVIGTGVPTVVLEAGRGALADTWDPIWGSYRPHSCGALRPSWTWPE